MKNRVPTNPESKGRRIDVERGQMHERTSGSQDTPSHHADVRDNDDSGDDEGSEDTPTNTFQRKSRTRRSTFVAFIIVIVLVLGGILALGFWKPVVTPTNTSSVSLRMEIPDRVTSGEPFDTTLIVTNTDAVTLKNVTVTLRPPKSYTLRSSSPEETLALTWKLSDLAPSQSQQVRWTGTVIGEKDTTVTLEALASYMPENFSSTFSETASTSTVIGDSIVGLQVETPLRVVSGTPFLYSVNVQNRSDRTLSNLRVEFSVPEDLTKDRENPRSYDEERWIWTIDAIEAGKEHKIQWYGTFGKTSEGTQQVTAHVFLKGDDGQYKKQTESSSLYFLVQPDLELNLSGSSIISLGDKTAFTVAYNNPTDLVYRDATISVDLTDTHGLWDLETFSSEHGQLLDNHVIWTKKEVAELDRIEPQEQGALTFTLTATDELPINESITEIASTLRPRVTTASIEDVEDALLTKEGLPFTVSVRTTSTMQSEGRYFDENLEPLGSGPIPPEVGKKTTYVIVWSISNTLNPLEDVNVTAELPDEVTFQSVIEVTHGNPLVYDKKTRTITWTIPRVNAYAGLLRSGPEASFRVSITPDASDVGTTMKLLGRTTMTARDDFTNEEQTETDVAVTTDLENDLGAVGKGEVVESADEPTEP
ncbi:MAG: hypothetical protein HYZ08_01955 [Candidatus Kerfeldbacteria bacterium]|nr:hypothetical protein [Candidatus Kerfeldbacteria bacterium]